MVELYCSFLLLVVDFCSFGWAALSLKDWTCIVDDQLGHSNSYNRFWQDNTGDRLYSWECSQGSQDRLDPASSVLTQPRQLLAATGVVNRAAKVNLAPVRGQRRCHHVGCQRWVYGAENGIDRLGDGRRCAETVPLRTWENCVLRVRFF